MKNNLAIIFLREKNEKINRKLFFLSKSNNFNFYFLNSGIPLKHKSKKIFNLKNYKTINGIFEKILNYKKPNFFLFINVSADEKYFLEIIQRSLWYFEKFKFKSGAIDFSTSCNHFKQIIKDEPRIYPYIHYNLCNTLLVNKFCFTVKREVLIEIFSNQLKTKIFNQKIEYIISLICFTKKLLICKDKTYKIVLDNEKILKLFLKQKQMIVFNEKKFFDYTNPSYLSFIEKMLFVAYRIPHVDFNFSNKTLNVLIPILKKKSS
jgi:hypothetical protein